MTGGTPVLLEVTMPRFKDQAICIRLSDWSESSQIVTLLSREHGKLRGLAKGSRRLSPSSVARYSGGFELLTAGQIVASTKPSSDLATLTEWDLQQPLLHLRQHLPSQHLALYAADLCNALLADHEPHAQSHDALLALLESLASPEHAQADILRFQWRLLSDAGYQLELHNDVRTRKPLENQANYLFDPQTGGFTTQGGHERADHPQGPWLVRQGTLETLRMLTAEAQENIALPQDWPAIERANRLLCVHVRAILDRELPTMKFLLTSPSRPSPRQAHPGPR